MNSVICPLGVIRPIAGVVPKSTNHRLPSGPATIPLGALPLFRPTENSVICPTGAACATLAPQSPNTNSGHQMVCV